MWGGLGIVLVQLLKHPSVFRDSGLRAGLTGGNPRNRQNARDETNPARAP